MALTNPFQAAGVYLGARVQQCWKMKLQMSYSATPGTITPFQRHTHLHGCAAGSLLQRQTVRWRETKHKSDIYMPFLDSIFDMI